MLRYLVLFCGLLCITTADLCAQFDYDKKSTASALGFECGVAPSPTSAVHQMGRWFREGRIDKIREALYSKHPTYQFLAVIIMDQRSVQDQNRINRIKRSSKKVQVCDGCFLVGAFPLKILLDEQNPGYFRKCAQKWLAELES